MKLSKHFSMFTMNWDMGFLEKVYQNSLYTELKCRGF
jgi:hypothetical protein